MLNKILSHIKKLLEKAAYFFFLKIMFSLLNLAVVHANYPLSIVNTTQIISTCIK